MILKQLPINSIYFIMAKYSKKAQEKIATVMKEFKEGDLKSSSGKKVKERKQAVAIALSEAKAKGLKVPKENSKKKK
jgi:hypothetical protein